MLNFAVGPVMMDQDILDMATQQLKYFRTDEFSALMLENETMLRESVKASKSSRIAFLAGSGTAAMEAGAINASYQEDNTFCHMPVVIKAKVLWIIDRHYRDLPQTYSAKGFSIL